MPLITRLMLQNFKKFPELEVSFCADRNVLIGDNESGKSTILLALDLVLSDSRHRVPLTQAMMVTSIQRCMTTLPGTKPALGQRVSCWIVKRLTGHGAVRQQCVNSSPDNWTSVLQPTEHIQPLLKWSQMQNVQLYCMRTTLLLSSSIGNITVTAVTH